VLSTNKGWSRLELSKRV